MTGSGVVRPTLVWERRGLGTVPPKEPPEYPQVDQGFSRAS